MATEGAIYRSEHSEELVEVVDAPDTFGVPTHKRESMQVELETLEDGTWYTEFHDNFRSNYVKVADSEADLEVEA